MVSAVTAHYMFRIKSQLWVLGAILMCAVLAFAQNGDAFRGIQRYEGWNIPGLKGSTVAKNGGKAITESFELDGQTIQATTLQPGAKVGEAEYFTWSSDGILHMSHRKFLIGRLVRYEVNGVVFAYSTGGAWVDVRKDGKVIPLSGVSNWTFVDVRGKGVFQLLLETDRPTVPNWVRPPHADQGSGEQ